MTDTLYIFNEDPLHFFVEYFDQGDPERREKLERAWQTFQRYDPLRRLSYKIWLRKSNEQAEVAVDHLLPSDAPAGRYRVETFVPGVHATTQRAVFVIATGVRPTETGGQHLEEQMVLVDMNELYDVWYSLGEYYLEPGRHPHIGRVRQLDITREEPPTEISFGPVRFVPLTKQPGEDDTQPDSQSTGRFDSPVGAPEERQGPFPTGRYLWGKYPVWAGDWFDANPFLFWYSYGYHTGADLNLPGVSSADKGKPIYAIGDGLVTYAGKAGSWGYIIVIEHASGLVAQADGSLQSQMVYSRYGHVEPDILARAGQTVHRGQHIGGIGLAAGATSGWHLHFDISYTDILKKRPAYWPDLSAWRSSFGGYSSRAYSSARNSIMRQVVAHFIDPLRFIKDNH